MDEVWFTPTPDIRWDKTTHLKSEVRIEILRTLVETHPQLKLCDLEVKSGPYRGAYVFLKELKETFKEYQFYLLLGADTYHGIEQWRDPRIENGLNGLKLLQEIPLILFAREGVDFPIEEDHLQKGGLLWECFKIPKGLIGGRSSTKVRAVLQGDFCKQEKEILLGELVPKEIIPILL